MRDSWAGRLAAHLRHPLADSASLSVAASSARATAGRLAVRHAAGAIPAYEDILARVYGLLVHQGDTVVDVGAHSGRHLVPLAGLVGRRGRALGFEPIPDIYAELARTCADLPQVELHRVALADFRGGANFVHSRGTPQESGLRERQYNQPDIAQPETIPVEVDVLDSFTAGLTSLRYIKIDIEGGELSCISGAQSTIERLRPLISVEYGYPAYSVYGQTNASLWECTESLRYRIGDLFGNIVDSLEQWAEVCDVAYWDYFLVPCEQAEWWHATIAPAIARFEPGSGA